MSVCLNKINHSTNCKFVSSQVQFFKIIIIQIIISSSGLMEATLQAQHRKANNFLALSKIESVDFGKKKVEFLNYCIHNLVFKPYN